MKLKQTVIALSLMAGSGMALAQQPIPGQIGGPVTNKNAGTVEVQDGIAVKPLSRWRNLQDARQVDQQAQSQYAALLGEAQQKGVLVPASNAQVVRLRAIAKRLIPHATRWNADAAQWQWQVNLLDSPQVNAFCMPGGRIAFFSGILATLKLTDDEVAVVMGHEIAHALREHGREQAAKSGVTAMGTKLFGAGVSALFGVDPRITDTLSDMTAKGISLRFSRGDEKEADLVGLDLAARAGFDPRAGVVLWQKMGALNQGAPPAWLSTHPSGADRIDEMNRYMAQLLPVYARSKGLSVAQLPPYRGATLAEN
ncbi:M48 family metallopeptidase [Janthinobacterium agaricidamnosum]|uniref:Peptidase M48 family protein n=1 Tax=Janthinobacterium agaricidamnosum NBRC 102515 = DSM 9628 TaxID=1349767 RepID=W0VBL3_9BURK|nr:M48 family metallopeptidase [Janthinobacterium agaricidamnosum]CDG85276.1 peptidase M48 family protein [Janthinobacterium agaricidamnosum NBRC 102515 = DSM 9628]